MATKEQRQYWINLKRTNPAEYERRSRRYYWHHLQQTNPEEYERRSRRYYWHHLQQTNPEEFKRQQREHKLMDQHDGMTKAEAHKIVTTQDKLFEQNQLSLF
jgi:hypothetical protein